MDQCPKQQARLCIAIANPTVLVHARLGIYHYYSYILHFAIHSWILLLNVLVVLQIVKAIAVEEAALVVEVRGSH